MCVCFPVFFIVFRETLETGIIVSVLLSFLKQALGPDRDPTVYKKLVRQVSHPFSSTAPRKQAERYNLQVWLGTGIGLLFCIIIGAGLIGAFYSLGRNAWAKTESIWEAAFALVASIIITVMGAALLRVSKLQDKWRVKIAKAIESKDSARGGSKGGRFKIWLEKYAMFTLPFITVLREGLEAVIFIGGVSLGFPATAFPIPVLTGILCGVIISYLIYRYGTCYGHESRFLTDEIPGVQTLLRSKYSWWYRPAFCISLLRACFQRLYGYLKPTR